MLNALKTRVLGAMIARIAPREEGQALVEYGLILGLIAIVSIAALTLLGVHVEEILTKIANEV
jgi:pilus assembly protein Flp/PilA